jgi:hypothetical protein
LYLIPQDPSDAGRVDSLCHGSGFHSVHLILALVASQLLGLFHTAQVGLILFWNFQNQESEPHSHTAETITSTCLLPCCLTPKQEGLVMRVISSSHCLIISLSHCLILALVMKIWNGPIGKQESVFCAPSWHSSLNQNDQVWRLKTIKKDQVCVELEDA